MKNYIDEELIPIKTDNVDNHTMSLDTGYYIEDRLYTFCREHYFDKSISIYIPTSFTDMADDVKEMKYTSNFRPDIIKTSVLGEVDIALSLLDNADGMNAVDIAVGFSNMLAKMHKGIKLSDIAHLKKDSDMEICYFDFMLMGMDERTYNLICISKVNGKLIQITFNCKEDVADDWKMVVIDILKNIEAAC